MMPSSMRATRVSAMSHDTTRIFLAIRRGTFPPGDDACLGRANADGALSRHDGHAQEAYEASLGRDVGRLRAGLQEVSHRLGRRRGTFGAWRAAPATDEHGHRRPT